MPLNTPRAAHVLRMCPHCRAILSFVGSSTFRGLWGYTEVHTYECSEHGPIFFGPHAAVGHVSSEQSAPDKDNGDRDTLIPAPRKPTPTLDAGAIAMPEPDPFPDN